MIALRITDVDGSSLPLRKSASAAVTSAERALGPPHDFAMRTTRSTPTSRLAKPIPIAITGGLRGAAFARAWAPVTEGTPRGPLDPVAPMGGSDACEGTALSGGSDACEGAAAMGGSDACEGAAPMGGSDACKGAAAMGGSDACEGATAPSDPVPPAGVAARAIAPSDTVPLEGVTACATAPMDTVPPAGVALCGAGPIEIAVAEGSVPRGTERDGCDGGWRSRARDWARSRMLPIGSCAWPRPSFTVG